MRYRPLGHSGLVVSVVGLGCNAFGARVDLDGTRAVVDAALDAGVTFFDTADTYSAGVSEEYLGAALGSRRADVVVATKFGMPSSITGPDWQARASRGYIRRSVEGSLRRLGTEWIDLYQLHQPDHITPYAETIDALEELVREGKIRYYGSSNFHAWELADAQWTATTSGQTGFVSAQNEYSLYNRVAEAELVPACERFGLGLLPYFPLAYGLLTGKYSGGQVPDGSRLSADNQRHRLDSAHFDRVEALTAYAEERGRSVLDVAIGGLAAQPTVTSVIAGASRPEQLATNVAAGSWIPSEDDLEVLSTINADPAPGMTHASFRA